MNRQTENKIILVTRPTRLADLIARFNTISQARFYIEHLGADFSDYEREDESYRAALRESRAQLERLGRVQPVDRGFLPNFIFGPGDTVVTLGQDGLVANTLKYLDGQPVVGVNPDPARWDGQLLPFEVRDLARVVPEVFARRRPFRHVTMVRATLNTGQSMHAVNDLFIGPKSHGSARYEIRIGGASEAHSSSGVIVSTGLGSTGWLKSLLAGAAGVARSAAIALSSGGATAPAPTPTNPERRNHERGNEPLSGFAWDADYLYFTVREPFPTRTTGASIVFGKITPIEPLEMLSHMAEGGVIFSDGIEKDFLEFNSGTKATISVADRKGVLVQ